MTVIFQTTSKTQNRYSISGLEGFGKVYFPNGAKATADKDLIKALLNCPLYERGDYYLVTNEEQVENYLSGKEADTLTEEILDGMTLQGIKELGKLLNAKNQQPTLIKFEIQGKEITTPVQELIDFYKTADNKPVSEPESEEEIAEPATEEEIEVPLSTDMTVKEASEYIDNHTLEELEGFVPEYEDRKTVLRAIEAKQE